MMLQAEPSSRTDAASRPARKLISLGVNPSAQAAQWAARRTQKAPKAASAAEVSHLFDPSNPWPLLWLSSLLACADAFNVMAHLDVPQLEAIVLTAFIQISQGPVATYIPVHAGHVRKGSFRTHLPRHA